MRVKAQKTGFQVTVCEQAQAWRQRAGRLKQYESEVLISAGTFSHPL